MNKKQTPSRILKTTPPALRRKVLRAVRPVGFEWCPIERSRGRILAETINAPRDYPEMHRSAMDGYAVCYADIRGATPDHPARLVSVGSIPAGRRLRRRLRRGEAARIMTGAPLPPGADTVVRVERVRVDGDTVLFTGGHGRFHDVRRAGSEIRKHETVLRPGRRIGASQMALLALMDRARVRVYRRPRVGILSTGDELGPVGQRRPYGHIPDSNRYELIGLIESAGCLPVDGGHAGDSPRDLKRALKQLVRRSDFIITTGGVSAGDFDVVKVLFGEIGGVDLYRLPMKPGKPQAFGHIGGIPFFGLPGNPVSAMVVFDFIVRPSLRKLAGEKHYEFTPWRAGVSRDFPRRSRQWEFPRALARQKNGHWTVRPVRSQSSANLRSISDADGYLVLSPDDGEPVTGADVLFVPLPQ